MNRFLLFFPASCLIAFSFSHAEPLRGRLPDGRAYRTTSDGSEVVDYIAELEVSVDALKRRVNGLEYELEASQKKVERLTKSGGEDSGFAERDLVNDRKLEEQPAKNKDSYIKAELQACQENFEQLKQKIALVRDQQDRSDAGSRECNDNRNARVALLEQQLSDARAIEGQLRSQIASQQENVSSIAAELAVVREQIQNNKQPQSTLNPKTREPNPEDRASLSARVVIPQKSSVAPAIRAIDTLRKDLFAELEGAQNLVATRDKLFSSYHQSNKPAVEIKAQRAQSQRGFSLSRISQALRSADSMNELTRWRRDLREIQKKMNDDIALIRRMKGAKK